MTVWLVHPVRDDVSDAARFGKLECIGKGYVYGDQIDDGLMPADVWKGLVLAASKFNPGDDYLLVAGDHLQLVQLTALLAQLYRNFQVLRWERQANAYMPVRIQT